MTAWGLGLGEIQLSSALNQPLQAEVELLSVDAADLENLTVELASFETFSRLGVERPALLMFLKFNVEETMDGRHVVKVVTTKPIREPFLDFILEVNWRSGRLLREYTLLLDPPERRVSAPPTINAPVTSTATQPSTRSTREPSPASTPSAEAEPTATMSARSMGRSATPGELVYGPVKADDTLWDIAHALRSDSSVSINQMMMALYKSNRGAFIKGNINRLKKGQVLRIDDPRMLTAMNRAEAATEVLRHQRNWEDYKEQAAMSATQRVAGQVSATAVASSASVEASRLKLVSPTGGDGEQGSGGMGKDMSGASTGELENELMLAMESAEAHSRQNKELHNQVLEMEERMAAMERLLALKNDDLAALQRQLRGDVAPDEAEAMGSMAATSANVVEEELAAAVAEPAETLTEERALVEPAEGEEATASSEPIPALAPEGVVVAESVDEPAKPQPAMETKPSATEPEQGLVDMIFGNPVMLAGVGSIVIVLLMLFMVMMRRRRQQLGFQESILSGGSSSLLASSADEGNSSETSFLSDLASGMGEKLKDEGEVDPLTEADVYMAYGRYQQAEELLKEAINNQPDRIELSLKLLELYHSTKNSEAFAHLAADSKIVMRKNESMWNKVLVLGHEVCPDDPFFSEGAELAMADDEAMANDEMDDVLDIGLDLDALTAEMEGEDNEFDLGLDDLDFGDTGTDIDDATSNIDQASKDDLDLSSLMGDEPEATASVNDSEKDGLDFDLDFDITEDEVDEEASAPAALELTADSNETQGDHGLDFDLGDFTLPESEPAASASEESGLDLGSLDLDDALSGLDDISSDADLDALDDFGDLDGDAVLSDQDEITTKLDLAKAYIEMDDKAGAREMLEEVAKEGNDSQRQEAEELLKQVD